MSDSMRQSTTDKAGSALKPDSQKSTLEKTSDSAKSTMDSAAGSVQPDSEKGMGQKASDSLSGGSKDASQEGKGMMASAQETMGNAANSVSDSLGMNKK